MQKSKYSIESHVDPEGNVRINVTAPPYVSKELALVVGQPPAVVEARVSLNRDARALRWVTSAKLGDGRVEHMLRERDAPPSD